MPQFVFVNGPPRSGKDTLVRGLIPYIRFKHMKVSGPMKTALASLLNVSVSWIEDNKDTKLQEFGGITVRQALIDMSEKYLKELYGEDIMGKIAWRNTKASPDKLFITSDSGFAIETERLVANAGRGNCIVIRLHREGCTFAGDSRDYLPDGLAFRTYDLHNDRSREQLIMFGLRLIQRNFTVTLLREPDWVKL